MPFNQHGCNTTHPKFVPRRPFYHAQDGHRLEFREHAGDIEATKIPLMVKVPDRMSVECQYSRDKADDDRCAGCEKKHKQ